MDARSEKIVELFQKSWDDTEKWYIDRLESYGEHYKPLLDFISMFRKSGEDRFFRAGTSMSILIISRSVAFGIREDQKFVSIDVVNPNIYEIKLREPHKTYREFRISTLDDPRLFRVLKTLKETLVN